MKKIGQSLTYRHPKGVVRVGRTYTFNYPKGFSSVIRGVNYKQHDGERVIVIRKMRKEEADGPGEGEEQMYKVLTLAGTVLDVFESELEDD